MGSSKYLVIEADEYKNSFLNYTLDVALITNIDRDHLDYFKNIQNIRIAFEKFARNIRPNGTIILNKDNKYLLALGKKVDGQKTSWFSLGDVKRVKQLQKVLRIPGKHNIANALGAYGIARTLGIPEATILQAIAKYEGTWRRMEYKGKLKSAGRQLTTHIYDDYAHHPTEVKASLEGFREKFPNAKLICVYQPHQLQRLKLLFREFTTAFDATDILILLDVYEVSGREDKLSHNISAAKLAETISHRRSSPRTIYLPSSRNLLKTLNREVKNCNPEVVIVMMGAGDIIDITETLLQ